MSGVYLLFAGSLIFVMTLCFSFTSFLSSFSSFFVLQLSWHFFLELLFYISDIFHWGFFFEKLFCLLMLICLSQFPLALWQHNFVCFLCLFVFSNCYLLFLQYLCRALLIGFFSILTHIWLRWALSSPAVCIKFMGQGLAYGTI